MFYGFTDSLNRVMVYPVNETSLTKNRRLCDSPSPIRAAVRIIQVTIKNGRFPIDLSLVYNVTSLMSRQSSHDMMMSIEEETFDLGSYRSNRPWVNFVSQLNVKSPSPALVATLVEKPWARWPCQPHLRFVDRLEILFRVHTPADAQPECKHAPTALETSGDISIR